MDVKLVLTHFDFHLSAMSITLCPNCCDNYLYVNSVKTYFLMLSFPFHIHAILKLIPVLSHKSEKKYFGVHFLRLYYKNQYGDPHFLFHDYGSDMTMLQLES